ncbi:MAG: hypothetical protein LQ343_001461 [Gyalolechia ehrenbergii]|nr:MAG: hypothetical protein LQ343_001461 [Gyalolechia ehrenbergii]
MVSDFFNYVALTYNTVFHQVAANVPSSAGISSTFLPRQAVFPGPWEEYIKAPSNKSHIRPQKIWYVEGHVSMPEAVLDWQQGNSSTTLDPGGLVILEFPENIAGRVCFDISSTSAGRNYLALAYSESPTFAGRLSDATDSRARDLPLYLPIEYTGTTCVKPEFVRGAFKYLTIYIPEHHPRPEDIWSKNEFPNRPGALDSHPDTHQKHLGLHDDISSRHKRRISISSLYVNCTAFPSNPNARAYTGYFSSSSTLLNRIWYSGAYTLQLTTIDPAEGSSLIDFNRQVNHNHSPKGSWYSNFTVANGSAVTTDGAKRDRMAYPGDMAIAVPGIAMSTYDMLAVRNGLDTLFVRQYANGALPYAGPPMGYHGEFSDTYHLHTLLGVWNYILFTNDVPWLQSHWHAYLKAFEYSLAKVDRTGLFHVTSTSDWLRPGMTGHNLEATSLMYHVLGLTIRLADEIVKDPYAKEQFARWKALGERMEWGIEILWCGEKGLYGDNVGRRGCGGHQECMPQDGNSWALLSGIIANSTRRLEVSTNLRKRWTKYGAPATEFPNVISPFASSFELLAHCRAGNHDAAVELAELMWGYMLDGDGFTNSTCVEGYRIDGDIQYPAYWSSARNSHAHGWSTGPTMVLLTEILGIKLETPLGRRFRIEPHLTKWLKNARGGFATGLGRFEVVLRRMKVKDLGRVEVLDLWMPAGSKGVVEFGGTWYVEGRTAHFIRRLDKDTVAEKVTSDWMERELLEDDEWQKPEMEERPVGVVDWKALEENYVTGP